MRTLIALLAVVSFNAMAADAPAAPAPAPQCYSGDDGKFYDVGQKTKIAGIEVVCTATADKKSASWTNPNEKK